MAAVGIIFSNIREFTVPELTRGRTMASIPFGGRYRLIDFVLSNMVNAGIGTIGVITKRNYQSLMSHVGSGRDWDLDRKSGGLVILPPFGFSDSSSLYKNRLEALKGITNELRHSNAKHVVMSDCDIVANFDIAAALRQHEERNADVTIIYKKTTLTRPTLRMNEILKLDEEGRVRDLAVYQGVQGEVNLSMDILIMDRLRLLSLVEDAVAHGYTSLTKEVLVANLDSMRIEGFEHTGHYCCIDSMEAYLESNLKLLDSDVRREFFNMEERPIFTKVKDSPPTKYGKDAKVHNSMIADGCVIEGTVENSVLFRSVKVGRGAVVRNTILMQDAVVGDNASLDYVVADKRVVISDGRTLCGYATHPFFINKNSHV